MLITLRAQRINGEVNYCAEFRSYSFLTPYEPFRASNSPPEKTSKSIRSRGGITNTSYLVHKINRAFAVPPLPHLLHFNNGELSRFAIRAISLLFVFLLKRELEPKIKLISSNSQSDEILDFRPLRRGRELGSAKWTSGEGMAVAAETLPVFRRKFFQLAMPIV